MPGSSRDFQRAALQRLTTTEFLLEHGRNLDAMYLPGYTIECTLKALILHLTPTADKAATLKRVSQSSKMHEFETLKATLAGLGCAMPLSLVRRLRRSTWSTSLRYETGRTDTGETRAFMKTAKAVYEWVERELP